MRRIENRVGAGWLLVILLFVIGCSSSSKDESASRRLEPASAVRAGQRMAGPEKGVYTGAYIDFGDQEDTVTLETIQGFDQLIGKRQALIGSSNFWGKGAFPRRNMDIISAYGAVPLLYWNPWDDTEWNEKHKNRFTLYAILAGQHDAYIDRWADEAKAYGKPLLVAWGLEMNGEWFPWSGVFHGGGKPVPGTRPVQYQGPENFKKAYRYIVDRVRARGTKNIAWVFHVNNSSNPYKPLWNSMAAYYPGASYVDWLAMSAYGKQFPRQEWITFDQAMQKYYKELANVDAHKPILIAEWGVGHFPKSGSQADYVAEALKKLIDPNLFPRLKGAVYWSERWQNADGSYSNLRINASDDTLAAFSKGVADPRWIDRPSFIPSPSEKPLTK